MAKNKINKAQLLEAWGPAVKQMTNNAIDEKSSRFEWMCEYAHNHTQAINEEAAGGATFPFSTLYNTNGIGNPQPARVSGMTAASQASSATTGSGDKWPSLLPMALQVAARTVGFDLINTVPTSGPTYVIPFLDYVYAGSKDAYGATPSYNGATANPQAGTRMGDKVTPAYNMYEAPHAFRCKIVPGTGDASTKAGVVTLIKAYDASEGKINIAGTDASINVSFIGLGRVSADPMFKVMGDSKNVSLGQVFGADASVAVTLGAGNKFYLNSPKLISALEDQVLGFTGAGAYDSDKWSGTFHSHTHMYEPMNRATGEMQYARQMSLKVFTKWGNVGTQSVGVSVTQEQVQDLQKQWGIDVIKLIENAAINELSQSINKHILSRLFALGWRNHVEAYESEGVNLNLSITGASTTATHVTYFETRDDEPVEQLVSMPVPAAKSFGNFENADTTFKKVYTLLLGAGNLIMNRGRRGPANAIVCSWKIATMLQTNSQYAFTPITNTINQNNGSLYPLGTLAGMTVYVDPLLASADGFVLVSRKGAKDEPGVIFCPYIMAESVRLIAEQTAAPKIIVKSRYSLVDAGFYPELNYLTLYIETGEGLL